MISTLYGCARDFVIYMLSLDLILAMGLFMLTEYYGCFLKVRLI